MFPLVIGFAALLGAQVFNSVESSYIRLAIDKQAVRENEQFAVDVFAYAHVPVNAVDITLEFNGDRVSVLGVDRGQSVLTIWTEEPIINNNSVTLRGGTFRRGFLGEHLIATINVEATQIGNSQFTASDVLLLAGDGEGTPVSTTDSSGSTASLYVYDESASLEDIRVDVAVNLVADLDGDGQITLRDISVFMTDWASRERLHDFNGDGRMSFRDFSIILADFFFQ
jgi:hypothetical protein